MMFKVGEVGADTTTASQREMLSQRGRQPIKALYSSNLSLLRTLCARNSLDKQKGGHDHGKARSVLFTRNLLSKQLHNTLDIKGVKTKKT